MAQPNEASVIQKMIELEETVGRLYEIYHDLFPAQKGFWDRLAAEEKTHAEWISKFLLTSKHGTISLQPNRFKIEPIQMTLDSLAKQIKKAREGKVTLLEALSFAFNFENGLVEKEFFKIVDADSDALKKLLGSLSLATENHSRWIQQVWLVAKTKGEK